MTPKLFDIFSKSPKKKKQEPKEKILVDYRERNCLIPSALIERGFEIEFQELKVADYLVKGVAIERKTVQDFISSIINGRMNKQLEELKQYQDKLLIIEGYEEHEIYNDENGTGMHANSIRGFLLSTLLKHQIPVLFTKNYKDTAMFIALIAKKKKREEPLNVKKKSLNTKEQLQYILESFPGIGPKNAKKLLQDFGTIQNIINASIEELTKSIGKKAEVFRLVKEDFK